MTVKVITFRELQRLTVKEIQSYGELVITVDGKDCFKLVPVDSQPAKRATLTDKLTELPLSKHRQAEGMTAQLANYVPY